MTALQAAIDSCLRVATYFKLMVIKFRLQHTFPWPVHGRVQSSWLARTFSWPRWVYLMVIDLNEVDPESCKAQSGSRWT